MRLEKRKPPKRMLSLLLALVLAFSLLPLSVLAGEEEAGGWDALESDLGEAVNAAVLEDANSRIAEESLAFSITAYEVPAGTEIDPDGGDYVNQLATGTLSVTDEAAAGGGAPLGEAAAAPVAVTLPVGKYTISYDRMAEGQYVKAASVPEGGSLEISEGGTAALAYTLTNKAPEALAPELGDYVTKMTLSVNGAAQVDLTNPESAGELALEVGDKIEVECGFSINKPWALGFRNGVEYTLPLPEGLAYRENVEREIREDGAEDGAVIGTFRLNAEARTASFTFAQTASDPKTGVDGYLSTYADFVEGGFGYTGTVELSEGAEDGALEFTVAGKVVTVPVTRPEVAAHSVEKSAEPIAITGNAVVRWTITVKSLEGGFPAGLLLSDEMTWGDTGKAIHELRALEHVSIDGKELAADTDYRCASTEKGFGLTLEKAWTGTEMTIVFTSNLSAAGRKEIPNQPSAYQVRNTVTVTAQEAGGAGERWGVGQATTNFYVNLLEKKFVAKEGRKQTWRLFVNKSCTKIPRGAVITDTLPEGFAYVEGSAAASLWDADKGLGSDNIEGYTAAENLLAVSVEGRTITFTLQKTIDAPMAITLTTRRLEEAHDSYTITNRAEMTLDGKTFTADASAGTGTEPGTYLYKNGMGIDLTERTAGWDVFLGNTPGKATMTDWLTGQDLIAADAALQSAFQDDEAHKFVQIQKLKEETIAAVKGGMALRRRVPRRFPLTCHKGSLSLRRLTTSHLPWATTNLRR